MLENPGAVLEGAAISAKILGVKNIYIGVEVNKVDAIEALNRNAADFGVRTQINYSIEASYNDGAKLVLFTGMNGTSSEQTYESLNNILALSVEDGGLGVPSGEPTDVDFYTSATIGTDRPLIPT